MPTQICKNPALPDYFHHLPDTDPLTHRDELGDNVPAWYEAGDVIIFDKPWLKLDLDFLRKVPVLQTDDLQMKKSKPRNLMLPLTRERFPQHLLFRMFPKSIETAKHYQDQIISATAQMDAFVDYAFPGYKIIDRTQYTWRFTLSVAEPLHWDSYGKDGDDNARVRIFVNLDDIPRVWGLTHRVQDAIGLYRKSCGLDRYAHKAPNLFNNPLTENLPVNALPQHRVEFAPLSTWMVNSQILGHSIIYGRRMLAYTFLAEAGSVRRPEIGFPNLVRRALA